MGTAADNKAYFQRGSLFWFTIITLSFGYYTVKAVKGASAPFTAGSGPAGRTGRAGAILHPRTLSGGRLEPRKRRRRTGLLESLAEAGILGKTSYAGFPVWGREQILLSTSRLSVYIFQNGGGTVRGQQGCHRLFPYSQTLALAGHRPRARIFRVGCLLASKYTLSEPGASGPLHSVLGGPPSPPPTQWVLACLADSCGRVLVCHGIVQV